VKRRQKINFKVLALLIVYLFVNITSLLFSIGHNAAQTKNHSSLRQKTEHFFHFQRTARSAAIENNISVNRIVQNAAAFFIVLLFSIAIFHSRTGLVTLRNQFLVNYQHSYLRCRVIRA
jgi:hypothetical protein